MNGNLAMLLVKGTRPEGVVEGNSDRMEEIEGSRTGSFFSTTGRRPELTSLPTQKTKQYCVTNPLATLHKLGQSVRLVSEVTLRASSRIDKCDQALLRKGLRVE